MPAEASRLAPAARAGGNVSRIEASATIDDDRDRQAADDEDLRAHPAGGPVVGDVHAVAVEADVDEERHHPRGEPGAGEDREDREHLGPCAPLQPQQRRVEAGPREQHHEQRPERPAEPLHAAVRPPASAGDRAEHGPEHERRDERDHHRDPDVEEDPAPGHADDVDPQAVQVHVRLPRLGRLLRPPRLAGTQYRQPARTIPKRAPCGADAPRALRKRRPPAPRGAAGRCPAPGCHCTPTANRCAVGLDGLHDPVDAPAATTSPSATRSSAW